MTENETIIHKLNNISTSLSGLYKDNKRNEAEIEEIIRSNLVMKTIIDEISVSVHSLITKMDGDQTLDVVGLRKRVEYLESRDKWLKSKWMYAVGAIGGITLLYAMLKFFDFLFVMYKNLVK
jgi:methyl coenzyme M reductase subunit C-like uncharacterized protein (methanogenesis marker protein 7)